MDLGLALILLTFAVWRATRLVVEDDFPPIRRFRELVIRLATRPPITGTSQLGVTYMVPDSELRWYGELITCPWCVSVWLSAGGTLLLWLTRDGGLPLPFLVFGGVAGSAITLYQIVDRLVSGTCDREGDPA